MRNPAFVHHLFETCYDICTGCGRDRKVWHAVGKVVFFHEIFSGRRARRADGIWFYADDTIWAKPAGGRDYNDIRLSVEWLRELFGLL